ncbi:hypothetical protein RRG08_010069 [Elysia crispata]|uniref:Uncharacterized protein n=1 Tax=Elysia crispata TaxID=231223 RepID=A0AAE1B7Z5_9GAST|nr:hypothetical protein RRG08_010069 [Elysia crispata]
MSPSTAHCTTVYLFVTAHPQLAKPGIVVMCREEFLVYDFALSLSCQAILITIPRISSLNMVEGEVFVADVGPDVSVCYEEV